MSVDNSAPIIRRRTANSQRSRNGLIRFARDNTSQNGEDGIIERLFELLPVNDNQQRYCVDVGAWDGKHLSNTYSLLVKSDENEKNEDDKKNNFGWKGVMIEADTERFQQLQDLHAPLGNICLNVCVSCAKESNNNDNLVSLLKVHASNFLPMNFDFLCIDVDGSDYWLLNDLWAVSSYRPKVVCIEFNPTMPDDLIYIPARNDSIRHGASLSALVQLAREHSYTLVETTLYNAFFVDQELYNQYLKEVVPDTSIEALHEITMGTSMYQLYDGTIKLWGCKKLLWHRLPINESKIQILPPEQRNFPFAPTADAKAWQKEATDMRPYCINHSTSSQDDKQLCSDSLLSQLKKDGFAFIRGTGISQKICQEALQATNSFLHEANEDVRRSCLTKDRARRGYSPMCTENFASLIGEQGPNDLVRKFRMGPQQEVIPEISKDIDAAKDNAISTATSNASITSPLLRPNVWPDPSVWDESSCQFFQSSVEEYYAQACNAAHAVVRAICHGVIQQQQKQAQNSDRILESLNVLSKKESLAHTSILTLLGYRVGTRHKAKRRQNPLVAAHTDVGVITMLLFDSGDCAVLQRQDRHDNNNNNKKNNISSSSWKDVTLPQHVPNDPIFVVNIADCFSDLSHSYLPSTLHRVMPATGSTPRNCLALFVGLDPTEKLTINNKVVTYEEWRKQKIAASQSVLITANK